MRQSRPRGRDRQRQRRRRLRRTVLGAPSPARRPVGRPAAQRTERGAERPAGKGTGSPPASRRQSRISTVTELGPEERGPEDAGLSHPRPQDPNLLTLARPAPPTAPPPQA